MDVRPSVPKYVAIFAKVLAYFYNCSSFPVYIVVAALHMGTFVQIQCPGRNVTQAGPDAVHWRPAVILPTGYCVASMRIRLLYSCGCSNEIAQRNREMCLA
jgi:hypothetical protein